MLQEDSVRNLQYDSDIRVAQPTRIDPISKKLSFFVCDEILIKIYRLLMGYCVNYGDINHTL